MLFFVETRFGLDETIRSGSDFVDITRDNSFHLRSRWHCVASGHPKDKNRASDTSHGARAISSKEHLIQFGKCIAGTITASIITTVDT
jgi:hypothetical protein